MLLGAYHKRVDVTLEVKEGELENVEVILHRNLMQLLLIKVTKQWNEACLLKVVSD